MAIKTTRKALAAALGTTFLASLAASPIASAASNPFALKPLTSGYQVADSMAGNPCAPGSMAKHNSKTKTMSKKEGNCGSKNKMKMKKSGKEGSCGGKK